MEDKQILDLLWARSEQAIDALAGKFGRLLQRLAMNILNDPRDAEESVSDTYLALWNAIPPDRPDPLTAFVCRVGRNTALNHLRQRSAQKRFGGYELCLDELSQVLPDNSMEELLDARVLGAAIDDFLSGLDAQSRILFLRRYWFGDSIKEISRLLGVSQNTLTVRLHRIRSKLKNHLAKEGFWNET